MYLRSLDINVDCGESFGNWTMGQDEELLPLVTTANVACGFHASDPCTMAQTVKLAQRHSVAIGAHPGLPDLMGFGRRRMDLDPSEAYNYVVYQVGALQKFVEVEGETLHHVKPHGAMYWLINEREEIARAVLRAIADCCPARMFYWPAPIRDHVREFAAEAGLRTIGEFYVDLMYDDEGKLILERKKGELDIDAATERARTFVQQGWMPSVNGKQLRFDAESLCVHGDGPNGIDITESVRRSLGGEGVEIAAIN